MFTRLRFLFAASLTLLCPLVAQDSPLSLAAVDGSSHQPMVLGAKKAHVLFFVSPYCSTSNTFSKEMKQITADYAAVASFYYVHSDADQKPEDVLQHTVMNEIKAPVLIDKEQTLARTVKATTTPEAVVIGADSKVIYRGRINDLYLGPTKRQRQATTRDLRAALDAVREGRAIAEPQHPAMGCKIGGIK